MVSGYIGRFYKCNIPNVIVSIIVNFYDKNMYFDAFTMEGHGLVTNCYRMYINKRCLFFMDNYDQLYKGISHQSFNISPFIPFNKNVEVISTGKQHNTYIYTKDKSLYEVMLNKRGSHIYNAIDCSILKSKLKKIKCGDDHVLFLTVNGNVYGGGNNQYGQLTDNYGNLYNINYDDNALKIQKIINSNNIIDVNCGDRTSYILSNKYTLKAFGSNILGELGIQNHPKLRMVYHPTNVLKGNTIQSFDCGQDHLGCLTYQNELYMFGSNTYGQCGCKKYTKECNFGNRINITQKMVSIKCGFWHNIIKTKNNNYYAFGVNTNGELLIDKKIKKINNPMLISKQYIYTITQSNKIIIDIIPGYNQTFILQQN